MVAPAGVRSYIVQYRIGGRETPTRRYTIGKHGSPWTADDARNRARDLMEMVRRKVDPLDADRAKLAVAAETKMDAERFAFSTYADFFIKRHAEARKLRSVDDIRAVFRRDLRPHFGDKSITSIRRTDAQSCLHTVGERSGSAANKAHKWLRKMFAFAVNRGDLASSPMEGMEAPHQELAPTSAARLRARNGVACGQRPRIYDAAADRIALALAGCDVGQAGNTVGARTALSAEGFLCTVASVTDGDTFRCAELGADGKQIRVRLSGVAARERDGSCLPGHPCPRASAEDATAELEGMALGKVLACEPQNLTYGRVAVFCSLPSGRDLSCALLETGTVVKWDRYWQGHSCR